MANCNIEVSEDVAVIKAAYRKGFIDGLKDILPVNERYFDFDNKTWEINPDYLDEIIQLAQRFYTDVYVDEIEGIGEVKRSKSVRGNEKLVAMLQAHVEKLKLKVERLERANTVKNGKEGNWDKLRQFVSNKDLHKLHKALALTHHPDKGGDLEKMKLVNNLMDELKKRSV